MKNKEIILQDNNPKEYIVVELDNGICFVHNNKTGKNYFNQDAISRITGSSQNKISYHISRYKESMQDIKNIDILLKVVDSRMPITFYDFDVVTYIVYRINTLEAIQMRKYISDAIDEKFNSDAGFTQPKSLEPNHIDIDELESKRNDLQSVQKGDAELISRLNHRAKRLEQNGEMEELERTRETLLDVSNEFTEVSLLISDITELTKSAKTVTKLSPKVNGNKYFNQNYLVPFKKS